MIIELGLIITFLIFTHYWNKRKLLIASWKIPGPISLPIVGNVLIFRDSFAFLDIVQKLIEKYGSTTRVWFGPNLLALFSQPEHLEKIFTADQTKDKGVNYKFIKDALRGDGLFTKQGEVGKKSRKLLNPTVQHYTTLNTFYPTFNKQMAIFEKNLDTYVGKGEFDIFKLTSACTLDMISETTFGTQVNTQSNQNMDFFIGASNILKIVGLRILQPWLQVPFIFKLTKWHKLYNDALNCCHNFVNKIVAERIDRYHKQKQQQNSSIDSTIDNVKKPTLFVDLVIHLTLNDKLLPESDIFTEPITMLFAGFETTAVTTSFIALALALHPHYQEEVYKEIMSILPDKTAPVTYEDITKLRLGDRFIKETLRLFPTVPFVTRSVESDIDIGDINMPAGSEVIVAVFFVHRDKKIWGPNADQFNPDNFLPENFEKIPPYSYIPFAAGLRNCIGYKYANIVMKMFLFYLLRNHRFTTNLKLEDLKYTFNVTLKLDNTHAVIVHKRD